MAVEYALPKISVIMGVKYLSNDTASLERSVSSILAQTFRGFEFIICVKEASDIAADFLRRTAEQDSRVILLDGNGTNHLGGQLNRCIEYARGEFLARMDDDDYSYPDRFEKQLKYLSEHPDAAFVGCRVRLIRGGKPESIRKLPLKPEINDFLFVQPFIHPSLMLRRENVTETGGYSDAPSRKGCEDYDLLMRMYGKGFRGENTESVYLDYTLPPKGKSHRTLKLRLNETVTRFSLYSEMKLLPKALPYVVKPLIAGLIPTALLEKMKERKYKDSGK